jgi:hypothetical protein
MAERLDGKKKDTHLLDNIVKFQFAESLLKISTLGNFTFGDVYKNVANLEDIIQICLAMMIEQRRAVKAGATYTPVLHSCTLFL